MEESRANEGKHYTTEDLQQVVASYRNYGGRPPQGEVLRLATGLGRTVGAIQFLFRQIEENGKVIGPTSNLLERQLAPILAGLKTTKADGSGPVIEDMLRVGNLVLDRDGKPISGCPRIEWVDLRKLEIDEECQRAASPSKQEQMRKDFDPNSVGVLTVVLCPDGRMVLVDGQNRRAVLLSLGIHWWRAVILQFKTSEEAAQAFIRLNVRVNTTRPFELFRVQYTAEFTEEREIARILDEAGMVLCNPVLKTQPIGEYPRTIKDGVLPPAGRRVMSFKMVKSLFAKKKNILSDTFTVIACTTLPEDPMAVNAIRIGAIAEFLTYCRRRKENPEVDMDRLVEVAKGLDAGWFKDIASDRSKFGGSSYTIGAKMILRRYNSRLRVNKMPDWLGGSAKEII